MIEQYNEIEYDIAFGGTFYAYADISQFGINFNTATIQEIIKASMALTKAAIQPIHPELKEASYLSGSILYDSSQINHMDVSQKFILVYGNCHVSQYVIKMIVIPLFAYFCCKINFVRKNHKNFLHENFEKKSRYILQFKSYENILPR